MKKIHPTQKELLNLLSKNKNEPLTIRELQEELKVSSTSVIFHHIKQLEKKGYLKKDPSNPGGYSIQKDSSDQLLYLNLYGLAECGPNGRLLDGEPIDIIPISNKLIDVPITDAFIVYASGDSMEPKINDKDMVIAIKTADVPTGSIIVCTNEGKAMIKKIQKKENKIYLESINDRYKPFAVNPDSFYIEGIVKKVLSSF